MIDRGAAMWVRHNYDHFITVSVVFEARAQIEAWLSRHHPTVEAPWKSV